MPQNFIACDRGQTMLMAPDLTEWVPDDHVVWSILGAVDQMDLGDFYGAYREDGQGQAAYEPSMMGWIQLVVATPDVEELRNGQEESTYGSCRCCRDALGGTSVCWA